MIDSTVSIDEGTQRVWLKTAYLLSLESKDPSTQNGAFLVNPHTLLVMVPTMACNEFPEGVQSTEERWERPLKYSIVEHAERNAIYSAARCGLVTEGMFMVAAWAACCDCARAIIQAGITRLFRHAPPELDPHGHWGNDISLADQMLEEAGVVVDSYQGNLGLDFGVLRDGKIWHP